MRYVNLISSSNLEQVRDSKVSKSALTALEFSILNFFRRPLALLIGGDTTAPSGSPGNC